MNVKYKSSMPVELFQNFRRKQDFYGYKYNKKSATKAQKRTRCATYQKTYSATEFNTIKTQEIPSDQAKAI